MSIAESLKRALDLWVELSGVSPNQKSFKVNLGGGLSEWDVAGFHEAISQALILDNSNVTGYLMLDALSHSYFKERTFSVDELLSGDPSVAAYIDLTRQFKAIIGAPEFTRLGADFTRRITDAVTHYGANTPAVMEAIQNTHRLAFLRRDALKSIEQLRIDQFLTSEPEPDDVKPVYTEHVHRFWNINSLINMACKQASGISLNLIVDPDEYFSYFAFAIRNGGNLFILSDAPKESHPLRRFKSRRPDRDFIERESKNHFPYDLLGVKYIDVGEDEFRMVIDRSDQTNIIPLQQEFDCMKPINALKPNEIIWLVMMFDLIIEKYWCNYQAPELSYTGSMIVNELELLQSAEKSLLPVTQYRGINLPPLTVNDIHSSNVSDASVGHSGGTQNRWMEERYGHMVSPEAINLVATPAIQHYLEPVKGLGRHGDHTNPEKSVMLPGNVVAVHQRDNKSTAFGGDAGRYELHNLDGSSFGTKAEMDNDRIYLARHNYAKSIQRMADEDFYRHKVEVIQWWKHAVKKNKDSLIELCANEKFWFDKKTKLGRVDIYGTFKDDQYLLMEREVIADGSKKLIICDSRVNISEGYDDRSHAHLCCLTGAVASYQFPFVPQTVEALAFLAGCKVDKLPEFLQNWCASSRHSGNSIIDRIDPLDWALSSPWQKLKFPVFVALSKRGLAQVMAKANKGNQ